MVKVRQSKTSEEKELSCLLSGSILFSPFKLREARAKAIIKNTYFIINLILNIVILQLFV